MDNINDTLEEFFEAWKTDDNSRYYSWEHCYNFFQNNKTEILTDCKLLNTASLHLAFYLASWGMYRGSSNLLWKDYKIHENLIKQLCSKCGYLWNANVEWEQVKEAKHIIIDYYKRYDITATDTLITKILMGIFGCVPAYDNFLKIALKNYGIPQTFNEDSFNQLKDLAKTIKINPEFKQYPPMRLIDAYFWWLGGGKEAHNKRAK